MGLRSVESRASKVRHKNNLGLQKLCYPVAGKVKTIQGLEFAQRCDKPDLAVRAAELVGCGVRVFAGCSWPEAACQLFASKK
jgi:hypothetical protein